MQEKTCYLCWRRAGQEAVNLNCKEICVQKLKEASPRPVGVRVGALSAPQDPGSRAWKGVEDSVQSNLALKQHLEEKCWLFCTVFQEAESQCRQEGSSGSMTLEELLSWHFSPAGRGVKEDPTAHGTGHYLQLHCSVSSFKLKNRGQILRNSKPNCPSCAAAMARSRNVKKREGWVPGERWASSVCTLSRTWLKGSAFPWKSISWLCPRAPRGSTALPSSHFGETLSVSLGTTGRSHIGLQKLWLHPQLPWSSSAESCPGCTGLERADAVPWEPTYPDLSSVLVCPLRTCVTAHGNYKES